MLLSSPPMARTADIRMTSLPFSAAITADETERVASASAACAAIIGNSGATRRLLSLGPWPSIFLYRYYSMRAGFDKRTGSLA